MRRTLLALVLLGGCFSEDSYVKTELLNPSPRAIHERAPQTVEMFTTTAPTRPYTEVAALSHGTSVDQLRAEAARLGCDAVIVTRQPTSEYASNATGTCVVWRDAAPSSR